MLFNSYVFIFAFLPITLILFYCSKKFHGTKAAQIVLVLSSLFFYAWWDARYLALILLSAGFNYILGLYLAFRPLKQTYHFGLIANILLLAYFKYLNFFLDNINVLTDSSFTIEQIVLPLAISFFTFQQISYLTSCYQNQKAEHNVICYLLFICFFPQLIAGPIVHHKEVLKQFTKKSFATMNSPLMVIGLCIFIIGLAKKLILADSLAQYVDPVFSSAMNGANVSNQDAWMALFAYKFQLYFDFSGYADMAIGLGLLFGIKLPINFESPYKASNIFEFWNRWHITLARFMRSHVYRPLARRFTFYAGAQCALVLNIVIGGIWHGADWNFLLWGLFNGLLLIGNHFYRKFSYRNFSKTFLKSHYYYICCILITFFATMLSSVMFRSESLTAVLNMFTHLFVINDYSHMLHTSWMDYLFIIALFFLVWFFPNTKQIFNAHKAGISLIRSVPDSIIKLKIEQLTIKHSLFFSLLFFVCVLLLSKEKPFIYFQF
ncbi:MAG: MBOAT family protein [Pseudomonadales bacterium]|nr:MBOAT family protein [Pseudomonadales bacterium]